MLNNNIIKYILILAGIVSYAELDMCASAFNQIKDDFGVSVFMVETLISGNLIAVSIAS